MTKIQMNDDPSTVRIVDAKKALSKDDIIKLCEKYGSIKDITYCNYKKKTTSYIEFDDLSAASNLVKDQLELPEHLSICFAKKNENECVTKNPEVIENLETINNDNEVKIRDSFYLGPSVSVNSLIEESKRHKLNNKIISYNLENDNLFGKPLTSKWKKCVRPDFELNNPSFYKRFESCFSGEIKIEKKLGPKIFTGRVTIFNDGENVTATLLSISDDIESSEVLNLDNLTRGMLVGAFDTVTKSYGRGYIELVSGNGVNVAMIDYGRVINTTFIRRLPEKHTQKAAYSFKIYTKELCVSQLQGKLYAFKVCSASPERIVLMILDGNKEIKVQLKVWQPSVEELGVPYIDFKSGSLVELLKLKDMNSVYLRSIEKSLIEFLTSSWNSLAFYCYKHPQFLNREPLYGEIVGFKSTVCKNYTRGRIHKYLGDNIYCVKHMDNPFKENIKLSEMIELQFEHKIMPVGFIKVGLKCALPYPIQFEAKRLVEHVLGVRLLVRFDESDLEGWNSVDLEIALIKENLNSILLSFVEPSWVKDETTDSKLECSSDLCYRNDLLQIKLEENSVVHMVFVTFYDGYFYMRDKNFGKSFNLLSDMIKEYCRVKSQPYLPRGDELCLGQFPDGMWYRIICDQLRPGQLTQVHAVDLGNVAFLNTNKMKKLPAELLFHPNHVYPCVLDTSKQLNADKLEILKQYENSDCEFTVIQHLDGTHYLIKCPLFEKILE